MIRQASRDDAEAIATIYNHYVQHSVATFEEVDVSAEAMRDRMVKVDEAGLCWLVAVERGKIVGYAYASPWNPRAAYRHTVEVSVYLSPTITRAGWGTRLYTKLFQELMAMKIHVVIGGITLPNPASVAIHEKFGMEKVAHFKQVGFKFGQWLDVGYWQVTL